MASIVQKKKTYFVVYYQKNSLGERKQIWESYYSQEEAEKRKIEIENPIEFLGTTKRVNTVDDLLNTYVELYGKANWALSTYSFNISLINRYLSPTIGALPLFRVDQQKMSMFFNQLKKMPTITSKYKPNTEELLSEKVIFQIYRLLRSAFQQGLYWGYLKEHPMRNMRIKKPSVNPMDILLPDQVVLAIDKAMETDTLLALALQLAFVGSLRKGEILALTWDNIDFAGASVSVEKEQCRASVSALKALSEKHVLQVFPPLLVTSKSRLILKLPKTAASVRKLFIPQTLTEHLLAWKKQQDKLRSTPEYTDYNLVFANEIGYPVEGKELSRRFNALLEKCELPRVVFHSLRHTSTTCKLRLSHGNIKAVQGDNGHTKPDMVLNVYAHILDDERQALAKTMEQFVYAG